MKNNNLQNFIEFESSIRRIATMDIEINYKFEFDHYDYDLVEHATNQNIKSYLEQRKKFAQMYVSSDDGSLKETIMVNIQNINSIISNYIGLGFVGQKTLFDDPFNKKLEPSDFIVRTFSSEEPIDLGKIENK
jgi:hypothetical protein